MNNCLNCGEEIIQKNGGKERKFCDNNNACKQAYHNKNKKEPKYVQYKTFKELKEKFDGLQKAMAQDKPLKEIVEGIKKREIGLTNYHKVLSETSEETKKEVKEMLDDLDNSEIKKQIEAIKSEKMPSYITMPIAKKSWLLEREKRISGLISQLNK